MPLPWNVYQRTESGLRLLHTGDTKRSVVEFIERSRTTSIARLPNTRDYIVTIPNS